MSGLSKKRRAKLQQKLDEDYGYRQYADRDVEVREGACGHGVHAVRQFLPGELVIEICGQVLSQKKYDGSTYVMEMDDEWYLEPTIPGAYLNHSCNPNAELLKLTDSSMGIIAICNIEPGSEITFDYQWTAGDWVPRCQCGAPNCRGWVVGADSLEEMKEFAKEQKQKSKRKK
ncbi:SET domain protein [Roseimaritima multifibrata]|uniref:SET domain protein n=1 Tax=Roseimaritima multifibrata TaxID=1930274 RepID=A0A517M911_9BACT|nr:SET domain-containing protein-lysine N-methyltransferase [Roseimaritima multifibrata]QDS91375.1 SET domain protein [Roseimaritima multifibrata]